MKKILPLGLLLSFLLVFTFVGCAPPAQESVPIEDILSDPSQVPAILLDEKPFTPVPTPVMIDGRLYLPFMESLELLGIETENYADQDAVTAYHDNRYLKINTETLQISLNGKALPKDHAPQLVKGTLFVPSDVIFDSFNIVVAYPKDGVIAISHRDNQENPQLVDGEYYVPIPVKESDLQFSVPKTWSRLPGAPYRFGESSDLEDYQITFLTKPLDKTSDKELLTMLGDEAAEESGTELSRDSITPLQVNGLEGLTATYHYERNNTAGTLVLYLFKRDQTAYIFQGWVNSAIDELTVMRQIIGIARSLRFGDMVVDVQREHYIEAPAFFDGGITLTSALYSNMEMKDRLQISGTLSDRGVKWIYAAVTRGGDTLTQRIPVKDKAFSAFIHTPFGLGKHDLTLYASKDTPAPRDRILQVSVVNISPQETRWMIPSTVVDSDNDYITSQSSLLTYKTFGDYLKAKQLFTWVIDTIALKPSDKDPAPASSVYLKSAGSEQEIAVLYTALLRATEIPARIQSSTGATPRTWVEMQMNGQWVESDPVAAISRMKDGAPLAEAVDAHFNMSRAYFEEKYPVIETLTW